MKDLFRWHSARVEQEIQLVRWGHFGTPVLLFPTAGGDAEEVERFHLIGAMMPLIESGRIKVYSTDSIAGKAWISRQHSAEFCAHLQNRFDAMIYSEIVPAIRQDCSSPGIEIIATGASIGESWRMASVLGARSIPNRVDVWGPEWHHDWITWRAMLPKYLADYA